MFEWLWTMNTNKLLALLWLDLALGCCRKDEQRYESIIERFDKLEQKIDHIEGTLRRQIII